MRKTVVGFLFLCSCYSYPSTTYVGDNGSTKTIYAACIDKIDCGKDIPTNCPDGFHIRHDYGYVLIGECK